MCMQLSNLLTLQAVIPNFFRSLCLHILPYFSLHLFDPLSPSSFSFQSSISVATRLLDRRPRNWALIPGRTDVQGSSGALPRRLSSRHRLSFLRRRRLRHEGDHCHCSVSRLRMHGAVPSFPHASSWCDPLLRKVQWILYIPPGLTHKNSTFCPDSVFMCFV